MCLTLPEVLISVVGIEKVVPTWDGLDPLLRLLPRSSTGERMNPYTSTWSGVTPGDGPQEVHVVLLDNGRTNALADEVGRQALRCIRCSACLNVCPVYERTGGHAYGSVYPGPIGAILNPLLKGPGSDEQVDSLPYASSLCGACFEVCPVLIDIPSVLVDLRSQVVDAHRGGVPSVEELAFKGAAVAFSDSRKLGFGVRGQRPDVSDPARGAVAVVGIEKLVPMWEELDVCSACCRARSTGERMNPYTSTWTGVTPGDGPQEVHVVLLDNGRTNALADEVGRQALRCIRCSACLNVCPVYERTGGHAYGSVYPGPIGAILNPLLRGTA